MIDLVFIINLESCYINIRKYSSRCVCRASLKNLKLISEVSLICFVSFQYILSSVCFMYIETFFLWMWSSICTFRPSLHTALCRIWLTADGFCVWNAVLTSFSSVTKRGEQYTVWKRVFVCLLDVLLRSASFVILFGTSFPFVVSEYLLYDIFLFLAFDIFHSYALSYYPPLHHPWGSCIWMPGNHFMSLGHNIPPFPYFHCP